MTTLKQIRQRGYSKRDYERKRLAGMVKLNLWVPMELADQLRDYRNRLLNREAKV